MSTRKGKTLKVLPAGDRRRMSDGRNAFRKMSDAQRAEFLRWIGLDSSTIWDLLTERKWEE